VAWVRKGGGDQYFPSLQGRKALPLRVIPARRCGTVGSVVSTVDSVISYLASDRLATNDQVGMATANSSGAVEYLVQGTGPGVLLIHGTGADARTTWGPMIQSLSDRFTLVAPNLPGSGASGVPDGGLCVEDLAAGAVACAQAAGLERFHVVGHSLGAVVATAVAALHTESVLSLSTYAGWVTTDPRAAFQFDLWARLLRADRRLLAAVLQLTALSPVAAMARTLPEFDAGTTAFADMLNERIIGQIELDGRVDIKALLPLVQAPTLVIAGSHDLIVPTHHQRELAAGIRGADYVELAAGHALPFEDPARLGFVITTFLDTLTTVALPSQALGQLGTTR
jgi:pimeloyl-ACP methyl ester carboxylesterase